MTKHQYQVNSTHESNYNCECVNCRFATHLLLTHNSAVSWVVQSNHTGGYSNLDPMGSLKLSRWYSKFPNLIRLDNPNKCTAVYM